MLKSLGPIFLELAFSAGTLAVLISVVSSKSPPKSRDEHPRSAPHPVIRAGEHVEFSDYDQEDAEEDSVVRVVSSTPASGAEVGDKAEILTPAAEGTERRRRRRQQGAKEGRKAGRRGKRKGVAREPIRSLPPPGSEADRSPNEEQDRQRGPDRSLLD